MEIIKQLAIVLALQENHPLPGNAFVIVEENKISVRVFSREEYNEFHRWCNPMALETPGLIFHTNEGGMIDGLERWLHKQNKICSSFVGADFIDAENIPIFSAYLAVAMAMIEFPKIDSWEIKSLSKRHGLEYPPVSLSGYESTYSACIRDAKNLIARKDCIEFYVDLVKEQLKLLNSLHSLCWQQHLIENAVSSEGEWKEKLVNKIESNKAELHNSWIVYREVGSILLREIGVIKDKPRKMLLEAQQRFYALRHKKKKEFQEFQKKHLETKQLWLAKAINWNEYQSSIVQLKYLDQLWQQSFEQSPADVEAAKKEVAEFQERFQSQIVFL